MGKGANLDRQRPLERAGWGVVLIVVYTGLACLPLLMAGLRHPETDEGFVAELGKSFALAGTVLLALQIVLAARLTWVERPFGLDVLMDFHKAMAVFAFALILAHPILLAAGGAGWDILYRLDQPWFILCGKLALVILTVHVITSLIRQRLRLGFERWRAVHNAALLVFVLAFVHSWIVGGDVREAPVRVLWVGLLAAAVLSYVLHKFLAPAVTRRGAYRVKSVLRETHDVWTLEMEPPAGHARFDFRPGQFQFLTLLRGERSLPVEEHPFTIVSSPEARRLAASIKESGDFTRTVGRTRPGDLVAVRGPYGRFSYTYRPEERDLVFIAGGIGITPLLSMLRHMRDHAVDMNVLLLWGNKTEADIAFRAELEALGEKPRLEVVHVLSQPDESWGGETGYIDRAKIERLVGDRLAQKTYYVCGPPVMMEKVFASLRRLEVPPVRICYERFAL